eukprot:Skav217780  [mRNA]  locus=scaffold1782:131677:131886:+ [translate_table: standard]
MESNRRNHARCLSEGSAPGGNVGSFGASFRTAFCWLMGAPPPRPVDAQPGGGGGSVSGGRGSKCSGKDS